MSYELEVIDPDLPDLQQRDIVPVTVPVKHAGPITTHELPSRISVMFDVPITTSPTLVIGTDPKRKRVIMVSATDMLVSHGPRVGVYWPAKVPLVLQSITDVYACVTAGTGTVTVIPEEWSD